MTLRRRLVTQLALLFACLATTAGVALWGINGLNENYGVALRGYEEQRRLYEVLFHLSTAKLLLTTDFPDVGRARVEADRAARLADRSGGEIQDDTLIDSLKSATRSLAGRRPDAATLNVPLGSVQLRIAKIRARVLAAETGAEAKRQRVLLLTAIAAVFAAVVAVVTGVRGYRSIVRPLTRVTAGVHRVASGKFDETVDPSGAPREVGQLADDFNRMAVELRNLYRDLNDRVEARTRQLVRSERLAGVGFLAAGVAHEINNPLGIISGYAELWLANVDHTPDENVATLRVIRDEAFRCKAIVDRLLALARGPSGVRKRVRLDLLAADVAGLLAALPRNTGRVVRVTPSDTACVVNADAGELRQVVPNLLVNALQAVEDAEAADPRRPRGDVEIAVTRHGDVVDLIVTDDGRGIEADRLARLFEPFHTDRGTGSPRGLGLGLSISQAIIESHGGTIDAASAGPGRGSRFVVRLPAYDDAAAARLLDDAARQ